MAEIKEHDSLRVDIDRGLSEKDVPHIRKKYGANILTKARRRSFLSKFISNLGDPIIKILIGSMIINVAFMIKNINWPETIGIACAVFTATLVSTISEHGSERAFDKLNEKASSGTIDVIRDGKLKEIETSQIVPGDILIIRAGMMIPADCFLTDGTISVCEAPLTGEAANVKKTPVKLVSKTIDVLRVKTDKTSRLFKGCLCTKGEGVGVAVKVGDATEYGKIAKELVKDDRKSPLKEKLSELAKSISYIGYVAAIMIMAAFIFNALVIDSGWVPEIIMIRLKDVKFILSTLINAVTLGVSVIVVAVPEGLPMMITVVLSSNMKKMLRSGVLVRKMVGIETAGGMNILFSDKTGTLTTGNMSVSRIYLAGRVFQRADEVAKQCPSKSVLPLLSEHLVGRSARTPTEKALVSFCKGVRGGERIRCIEKLSFNSENKYSACLYEDRGVKKCAILGAAEKLLSMCEWTLDETGTVRRLDSRCRASLSSIISNEATHRARVIALVECDCEYWDGICNGRPAPSSVIALISIRDELRRDIASSVSEAQGAGVRVIMITGDNRETACAIAKEAGIIRSPGDVVLTGDEMRLMSDDELSITLERLAVVARALPSDKERLVEVSGKRGLVSGMTGDGINDAPSLKAADVGFAMGSGSDVAKEASDIILTNDSFKSITNAILYGRCVFESIRKFITFQLTMNLCALGVSLIGPFIGVDAPITVIQMLWVNIIMDTLGGLAFAGEMPLRQYMKREPTARREKILTKRMVSQILFLGLYTLTLCIAFLKAPFIKSLLSDGAAEYHLTCFFSLFIFCGIFNSFNARAPRDKLLSHISGNKGFIAIMIFVATVQLAIIYLGGETFRCVPINVRDLAVTSALALTVIPADMIRKRIIKCFDKRKLRRK